MGVEIIPAKLAVNPYSPLPAYGFFATSTNTVTNAVNDDQEYDSDATLSVDGIDEHYQLHSTLPTSKMTRQKS